MSHEIPIMPEVSRLPEAVQSLRTERERLFVWHYMLNGAKGGPAAKTAGYSDIKGGARVRACELLQRGDIQAALRALCERYLFSLAPVALFKLRDHLHSENERVSLKAVEMTLARTGFSERTALDVNVSGRVDVVNHTDAAVADLARMKQLGVPHEKLVEVFGFSGLSRYEKLLAASEKAKLIEHQPDGG